MQSCFKLEHILDIDPPSSHWLVRHGENSITLTDAPDGMRLLRAILDPLEGVREWSYLHNCEALMVYLGGGTGFELKDPIDRVNREKVERTMEQLRAQAKKATAKEYAEIQLNLIQARKYLSDTQGLCGRNTFYATESTRASDATRKQVQRAIDLIKKASKELGGYFKDHIRHEGDAWFCTDEDTVWDVGERPVFTRGEIEPAAIDLPRLILAQWVREASEPLREQIARSLGCRLLKRTGIALAEIKHDVEWANSRDEKHPVDNS
jgi:hypothetical protein